MSGNLIQTVLNPGKRADKVLLGLAIFIGIGTLLMMIAKAPDWDYADVFFRSDALYHASLYQDLIVEGGSITDWRVNPAPNFLPEMPLYFAVRAVAGSPSGAGILYGIVQYLLILLLAGMLLRQAGVKAMVPALTLVSLIMTCFWANFLIGGNFYAPFQILANGYHIGALLNGLFMTWWFFKGRTARPWYWWVLGVVYMAFAFVSDKLFLLAFLAPLPLYIGWQWIRDKQLKPLWQGLLWVGMGIAGGYLLLDGLKFQLGIDIRTIPFEATGETILESIGYFFKIWEIFLSDGFINSIPVAVFWIATIWAGLIALVPGIRKRYPKQEGTQLIALLFFQIVAQIAGSILAGGYTLPNFRYIMPAWVLAMVLMPLLVFRRSMFEKPEQGAGTGKHIAHLTGGRKTLRLTNLGLITALLALLIIKTFQYPPGKHLPSKFAPYPKWIAEIDSVLEGREVYHGLTDYQDSKTITMLSRQNLVARTSMSWLAANLDGANETWYFGEEGKPRPIFNWVVLSKAEPEIWLDVINFLFPEAYEIHHLKHRTIAIIPPIHVYKKGPYRIGGSDPIPSE